MRTHLTAFTLIWLLTLSACTNWSTSYSGKDTSRNSIHLFLSKNGRYMVGFCGVCRELKSEYNFDLSPIKREYHDDEIKLTVTELDAKDPTPRSVPQRVLGSVSFDDKYRTVRIDIHLVREGRQVPFEGNGQYPVHSND